MQTSSYGVLAQSSFAASKLVLATEGWRGFYRGFGSTIMREVILGLCKFESPPLITGSLSPFLVAQIPFTSLQFPLYELLKSQLSKRVHRKPLYAHEAALCGSIAGGVAAAITTPLDVLKTRVMLDLRVSNSTLDPKYSPHMKFRTPRRSSSPVCIPGCVKSTRTRVSVFSSLVLCLGLYGFRRAGPYFWVCMSGLCTD
jgi:hypothetical protein